MITAIQELLNSTGRAIIPELGCLSVNEDNKLVFNTFLKFNDGKLISWLIANEGLEENQALEKVNAWTKDLQESVLSGKSVSLGTLGRFYLEGKDEIAFSMDLNEKLINLQSTAPAEVIEKIEKIQEPDEIEQKTEVDEAQEEVEAEDVLEKSADDYPQLKNVYIPPVREEAPKDLDAILNKTEEIEVTDSQDESIQKAKFASETTHHETVDSDENIEDKTATIGASSDASEPVIQEEKNATHPSNEEENSSELEKENTSESHESSTVGASSTAQEKTSEEVTVKRKRSPFFYINIVLLVLIVGLGVFAFIYADEVSEWLGISAPKTELAKDSIPDNSQNEPELIEEEIIEDTDSMDLEATPEVVEIQEAPAAPTMDAPKAELKPKQEQPKASTIPAVAANGNFHIIVGKFAVKENADRLVQKIRDSGYDGKILRSTSTGHTVSFHTYPSVEDANNNLNKAKEITGTGAYVEGK